MSDLHPDAAAVEWTVPNTDEVVCGRIVSRTETTAVVDWGNNRIEADVEFADPMLRWLTETEVAVGT